MEEEGKYRYHLDLRFDNGTRWLHSFNSDSEEIKASEIRNQIDVKNMKSHGNYNVLNICRMIND